MKQKNFFEKAFFLGKNTFFAKNTVFNLDFQKKNFFEARKSPGA